MHRYPRVFQRPMRSLLRSGLTDARYRGHSEWRRSRRIFRLWLCPAGDASPPRRSFSTRCDRWAPDAASPSADGASQWQTAESRWTLSLRGSRAEAEADAAIRFPRPVLRRIILPKTASRPSAGRDALVCPVLSPSSGSVPECASRRSASVRGSGRRSRGP